MNQQKARRRIYQSTMTQAERQAHIQDLEARLEASPFDLAGSGPLDPRVLGDFLAAQVRKGFSAQVAHQKVEKAHPGIHARVDAFVRAKNEELTERYR